MCILISILLDSILSVTENAINPPSAYVPRPPPHVSTSNNIVYTYVPRPPPHVSTSIHIVYTYLSRPHLM